MEFHSWLKADVEIFLGQADYQGNGKLHKNIEFRITLYKLATHKLYTVHEFKRTNVY